MATPYPVHGQVDVYINKPLVYVFPQAVKENSLYSGSVVLFDAKDHHVVEGVLSYDPSTFAVQFLPNQALTPNTSYTWTFAGEDDGDTIPIEFDDTTKLVESIWIDFQTGTEYAEKSEAVPVGTDEIYEVIEDGQTLEERAIDEFRIEETSPKHFDSGIDVLTSEFSITFSKPLKAGQSLEDLITMEYKPLIRETYYFNNNTFNTYTTAKVPGATTVDAGAEPFVMPEGDWSLSVDGKTLTWTKTEDKNFNANAFVYVTISGSALDEDDNKLNGEQDESFYFLTQLFPMFTTVESVLLRLHTINSYVSEEVVLKFILEESLRAHRLGMTSLVTPSRAAQRYVDCAVVVDLLDNQSLQRQINRGKAIRLGELNVQYEFPRAPEVEMSVVRKEAAKCMAEAKDEMMLQAGNNEFLTGDHRTGIAVRDVFRNRIDFGSDRGVNTGNHNPFRDNAN